MVAKKFWLGISVLVLVFATAVSGCDNGLTDDDSGNYGNNSSIVSSDGNGSNGITLVCFGDSLTAGRGATEKGKDDKTNSYPAYLQQKVNANVSVVNAGVSSDTTKKGLARVDRDILSQNPDIVIVLLGANDFIRSDGPLPFPVPIATTKANFQEIIRKVDNGNRKIFLVKFYTNEIFEKFPFSLIPSSTIRKYDNMFTDIAKSSKNITLIEDIWTGVWGKHMSDNIHPNAEGYRIMADRIYEKVIPYLEYYEKNPAPKY